MKLLITSVGSLLGQNVLDSIESRRNLINVVGLNSVAQNPRNFRCDTIYKVHETSNTLFEKEFLNIISNEKPDIILPGRDEDCVFLADLREKYPERLKHVIPFGSSYIPRIMLDKYDSYRFCMEHSLPFAASFYFNDNNKKSRAKLNEFVEQYEFPLVAKPREGFGSQGVYFVLNFKHLDQVIRDGNIVLQEYLGNPEKILMYKDEFKKGLPLFFQIPEDEQFAVQSVIGPAGKLFEVFLTVNTLVLGRNEYIEQMVDTEVEDIVKKFSKVLFKYGWCGPLNLQMKKDRRGKWKVFELSPRQTGSTSGRLQLGYDEFGILCEAFMPEQKIPNLTKKPKVKGQVFKYLQDNIVLETDIKVLESKKVWKNPSSKNGM